MVAQVLRRRSFEWLLYSSYHRIIFNSEEAAEKVTPCFLNCDDGGMGPHTPWSPSNNFGKKNSYNSGNENVNSFASSYSGTMPCVSR